MPRWDLASDDRSWVVCSVIMCKVDCIPGYWQSMASCLSVSLTSRNASYGTILWMKSILCQPLRECSIFSVFDVWHVWLHTSFLNNLVSILLDINNLNWYILATSNLKIDWNMTSIAWCLMVFPGSCGGRQILSKNVTWKNNYNMILSLSWRQPDKINIYLVVY